MDGSFVTCSGCDGRFCNEDCIAWSLTTSNGHSANCQALSSKPSAPTQQLASDSDDESIEAFLDGEDKTSNTFSNVFISMLYL